jgi:hypothetical protein
MIANRTFLGGAPAMLIVSIGCRTPSMVAPTALPPLHPSLVSPVDTAPKEEPRLVPAEAYVRTWLTLFGGLAPLEAQRRARGGDGAQLFDTWNDYVAALGFPDYRLDLPRAQETNAMMVAAFERLGDALCDRAVEYDLRGVRPPQPPPPLRPTGTLAPPPPEPVFGPLPAPQPPAPAGKPANAQGSSLSPPPVAKRAIFAFDVPRAPLDEAGFAPRFDVLHRTFLGYPASLAPPERVGEFYRLYRETVERHSAANAPKSRFTPIESGWSAVCQGLARHPEFHLY